MRNMIVLTVVTAATVATAEAQIDIGGRVGYLDRRLSVQGDVEHQGGVVGEVVVVLHANIVRLSLSGGGGKLAAKTTVTPDVDYGRVSGELAVAPVPWLAFCGGVGVSAYVSDIGSQRWILPRVGAELRPDFANIPAAAYLRGVLIVGATTNSPTATSGGVSVQGGLLAGRGKIRFFVDYTLERLSFDTSAGREEQRGEIASGIRFRF